MTPGLVALSLLLASTLAAPAGDRSHKLPNGVEMRAWSRWPSQASSGWAPLIVELHNGSERPRVVALEARRSDWRSEWTSDAQIELEAGASRTIELLVPMSAEHSTNIGLGVRCDGERGWVNGMIGTSALTPGAGAIVLLTERVFDPGELERWNAALALDPKSSASPSPVFPTFIVRPAKAGPLDSDIAVVRAGELPSHTAAYTSLDLVVLDAAAAWPGEAQLAPLFAWMRSGGDVLVIGPQAERAARAQPQLASWMAPRFELLTDPERGAGYRAALGRLWIAHEATDLEGASAPWVVAILQSRSHATPRADNWRGRAAVPNLALETLPHRVFAALLLVFAILIGPVNFALVAKRKRPALLLITIPAISLAVTLLLLAYGIFHQGLDVKTSSWSASVLDQRTHVSSSIEKRQLFAGLAPATGLRPAAGSVLHAIPDQAQGGGAFGAENAFVTRHDAGWLLSGDFLPTRRVVEQMLTCDRAERARLDIAFTDQKAEVVNNLGGIIKSLLVRDGAGRSFGFIEPLAVGAKATLFELSEQDATKLSSDLLQGALSITPPDSLPAMALPDGCYLARMESGVFSDDCGIELNELRGQHVVLGVLPLEPEAR